LELSGKITRRFIFQRWQAECYAGMRNISNAYQSDFDKGKNRDSNYIYGPGMPRTVYLGCKIQLNKRDQD
jgi:outer membrane receptor for ferrienterochelin and colicins